MIIQHTEAIEAVNNGLDTPDAIYDGVNILATLKWHKTDAWRGYTEIVASPGYKKIDDDWVTGNWDDAPTGHSETEVDRKIKQLEAEHGKLHVVFAPTSNVFSTNYAVIVKDPDARPDNGKPHGHKTRRFETPTGYKIRYHATYVIEYNANKNSYILNSGGWATQTTKRRINAELPAGYYIQQRDFEWFVVTPDGEYKFEDEMEVVIS